MWLLDLSYLGSPTKAKESSFKVADFKPKEGNKAMDDEQEVCGGGNGDGVQGFCQMGVDGAFF